jgi:transforming growth factor-beta-induced protein
VIGILSNLTITLLYVHFIVCSTNAQPEDQVDIVETLSSRPDDFSILVSLVQSAGLEDELRKLPGPLTLFAPTNAAFNLLGEEKLDMLANDLDALIAVLTYHVVPELVFSRDFSSPDAVETIDGRFATISSLDPFMINGINIDEVDIFASNGVIHVIEEVLISPGTIFDLAKSLPDFTVLSFLILSAGLDGVLDGPGPLTVFAPTNDAFDKLPIETRSRLATDVDALIAVLTYHVVPGLVPSRALVAGDVTTAEGSSVTITLSPPKVNDIIISQVDIFASNGIMHVVDDFLFPPPASLGPIQISSSRFSGCIEPKRGSIRYGNSLILADCSSRTWSVVRIQGYVMFQYDEDTCAQAGLGDRVGDGTIMRITRCDTEEMFQRFMWNGEDGPITLTGRPDLCVVFRGVSANVNSDPIIVKLCSLIEDRRLPWKAV